MQKNYPWFLVSGPVDGRWWWDNVAAPATRRDYQELMSECDALARQSPDHDASILAAWSLDNAVGSGATVALPDEDGPCEWDHSSGSPPPWWADGIPSALVRRINRMSARIARDYHDWAYGPMRREYYSRAIG